MGDQDQLQPNEHDGQEGPEDWVLDPDGKTWRLVDGDYYCVAGSKDDNGGEAEEYDPVASARLLERSIAQFSRPAIGVSREQLTEMRRKWAARRADTAREARTRAQSDQARSSHPEQTPRPRATRARRPPTRSHATADPTPPPPEPDPAPAAVAALSGTALAGRPARAVPFRALPSPSSDRRVPALREGVADHEGGSSLAPRAGAVGALFFDVGSLAASCSDSSSRSAPAPVSALVCLAASCCGARVPSPREVPRGSTATTKARPVNGGSEVHQAVAHPEEQGAPPGWRQGERASTTAAANELPAAPEPEVLTVPELAVLLRMNEKSTYDLVARGKIPGATKVGRLWRVHRPTVVAWLAGQISAPRPKGGRR